MKLLLSFVAITALLAGGNALAIDVAKVNAALADPSRSDADKALDSSRKPAEILDFLGLEEGMTVLDVMSAGGWYTEVLSRAVGPNGRVYMQNSEAALARGTTQATVDERLNGRLTNVERLNQDVTVDLGLPANSIDFAITNLNFHDVYNRDPAAAQTFLLNIKSALKPGAVLGLIDHEGTAGADNAALHRMTVADARAAAIQAGFEIAAESDLLNVPTDNHTQAPFAAELERNTDRFTLKLVKPR
ncbi:MAG: SAM-dependent methyltransferase [Gammaproteobacteria bacterium]|nr:SAM-dependent methyltransferase [Gammaproteobacteria bacterium]MDP2141585.1 SAM-dependent methyltransferase [Gammaproteobacteria bacterium]MDP2346660.1 SAM-dependent methyltransferase [Gammaproteobacteria bacterium]